MFVNMDLHIHTTWSDGKLTIREVIDFYVLHNIHIIAITDHGRDNHITGDTFRDYMDDLQDHIIYAHEKGIFLIPGIEVSGPGCHVVVLNPLDYIEPTLAPHLIVDMSRRQNAFNFLAHPGPIKYKSEEWQAYKDIYTDLSKYTRMFDAIEIMNGTQLFPDAALHDRPYLANSDFHFKHNIYGWKNMLEVDRLDRYSIEKAICSRRNYLWRYINY